MRGIRPSQKSPSVMQEIDLNPFDREIKKFNSDNDGFQAMNAMNLKGHSKTILMKKDILNSIEENSELN